MKRLLSFLRNIKKNSRKKLLLAVFSIFVCSESKAQANLVQDIHPEGGSGLGQPIVLGDDLYFTAIDGVHGEELWKLDGNTGIANIVQDIRSGNISSVLNNFTVLGNDLYFSANDGVHGFELWKVDGNTGIASIVQDIRPGIVSSSPNYLTALGDDLYFSASDGVHGTELWKLDGNTGITTMVQDIRPGIISSNPNDLTVLGNDLYFKADDGVHGTELWKLDGNTGIAAMIQDILPGSGSSIPNNFTVLGDDFYFSAYDVVHGTELWKVDGNTGIAAIVQDIRPEIGSSSPNKLAAFGNDLYFSANDGVHGYELWKLDGNTGIAAMVQDILPGSNPSSLNNFTAFGDDLYFRADDGVHGKELWKVDGNTGIAAMVQDISPGSSSSVPKHFTAFRDDLYFQANDGVHGYEIWKLDGNTGIITMVQDILPGSISSSPNNFTVLGNILYFSANDGVHGNELWKLCDTYTTDTQIACEFPYTWIDGNNYNSPNNTAKFILENAEGCDSIIALNLTVLGSIDTQIACESSYTWIDGNTYTTSNNTATHTLENSEGCDSIITLNLSFGYSEVDIEQNTMADINTCSTNNGTNDRVAMTDYISYGELNKADGDWVNINGVVPEIVNTNRSVSAWIKHPNQVSGSPQVIVGMNTSGTATICNFLIGTGEKVYIYDGNNNRSTTSIITDGLWHHVAYTYDEDTNGTIIYIDGVVEKTYTNGQSIAATGRVSIGQEYDGSSTGNYFDGFISEVSIWNEVLSQSDIQLLMDGAITENHPKYENLKAYYTMNPSRDGCTTDLSDIQDSSGNDFHGVASNDVLSISNYEQISDFNSAAHFNKSWKHNNSEIANSDTLTIGSSSPGDYELVLSRDHINITNNFYLSDGNCMEFNWAKVNSNASESESNINKSHIDHEGYTYNAGSFHGTVDFDPNAGVSNLVSTAPAQQDEGYIQKLNVDGSLMWVKQFSSTEYIHNIGVATDDNGDLYVSGSFLGTADVDPGAGTFNIISSNVESAYLVKLDKNGNFLWATSFSNNGTATQGYAVSPSTSGNMILSGFFQNGDLTVGTDVLTNHGNENFFCTKVDTDGNILWARSIGNDDTTVEFSNSIKSNSSGDIFMMSDFSGDIDLDPTSGVSTFSVPNQGIYLVKLNSDGDFIEAQVFGDSEVSSSNNIYGNAIDIDRDDAIYITGYLTGSITFDSETITGAEGQQETYILKLNSSGEIIWVKHFGNNMDNKAVIATDSENNLYLTNRFYGAVDLDPNQGEVSLTEDDAHFILKISNQGKYLASQYIDTNSGSAEIHSIAVSHWGAVQLSGSFTGTVNFNPYETGHEFNVVTKSSFTLQYGDVYPNVSHTYYVKNGGSGLQNGYSEHNAASNISSLNASASSGDTILLMENNTINEIADISIANGVTMNILDGSVLNTQSFALSNNGQINLKATGALVQGTSSTLEGTGNFKIDRLAGNNNALFNFLSSPINTIDLATVFGGSNCIKFDPAEQNNGLNGWIYLLSGDLINGHGYLVNGSNSEGADGTRSFRGMANNGDISVGLDGQSYGGGYDGWNLLGNPYPSSLDMKNFIDNNSDVGAVTFYDQSVGMYVTYNTLNADGLQIASAQGFMVEFSTANSGTANFANSMRHESAGIIEKNASIEKLILNISDNNGETYDTYIAFLDDATDGFDRDYDAKLIPGANELTLFSMLNSNDYSIQGFAPIQNSKTIRLGMDVLGGETKIAIADLLAFDTNTSITLIDHQEEIEHDLRKSDYSFVADQGTNTYRFELRLERQNDPTEEITRAEINVSYSDKQISINAIEEINIQHVVLYDITGKYIGKYQEVTTNANTAYINIGEQANGIYLLELHTDKGIYHQKVYVQ